MNIGIAALCVGAVYIGYGLLAPGPTIASEQDRPALAIPVRAAPVVFEREITISRAFPGQIEARQTSRIGFEFGGLLKEIAVDEGDVVLTGQKLAVLDTDILQTQRAALLAGLDGLNIQLELAEAALERVEQLKRTGVAPTRDVDTARATVEDFKARRQQTDARLSELDLQISKSTIRAPYGGVIGARMADIGDTIAAGEPILHLFESGNALFRAGLPSDLDPDRFRAVNVEIDGIAYPARLRGVRPDIDALTRSRTVLFDIVDAADLPFGQQGTLHVDISQPLNGIWVPQDAMRAGVGDLWTVLIADQSNRATAVAVEILHIGDDRAFVSGAFEDGDALIVDGAHKVTPGQVVEIVE